MSAPRVVRWTCYPVGGGVIWHCPTCARLPRAPEDVGVESWRDVPPLTGPTAAVCEACGARPVDRAPRVAQHERDRQRRMARPRQTEARPHWPMSWGVMLDQRLRRLALARPALAATDAYRRLNDRVLDRLAAENDVIATGGTVDELRCVTVVEDVAWTAYRWRRDAHVGRL